MKDLVKLLSQGRKTEWGIALVSESFESELLDRTIFVSNDGMSLIQRAGEEVQHLINMLESAPKLNQESAQKDSSGGLGHMNDEEPEDFQVVPIRRGIAIAVKVYEQEHSGLDSFLSLIRALNEKHFDTIKPYLATRGYIFTGLIPDIPNCDGFVQMHPHLREDVMLALRYVQKRARIKNDALPLFEQTWNLPRNVYIERYNPMARTPEEKFKFFIVGASYENVQ